MITLGFDMGMGALKLWGKPGGLELVSQVASNGHGHLSDGIVGLKNRKRPILVSGDFGSFYVGPAAHEHGRPVENLDFDRLTGAPEMRVLLYAALAQYQDEHGPFDDKLSLMVGLPLQMMTGDSAKEYQRGVKAWLTGKHEFSVNNLSHCIEVRETRQTSQPVGALFDYVLDDNLQVVADPREEVGVISVGFNTVELLVVKDGGAVERFTRGNTLGVRRLLELINGDGLYSLGELDVMVRAGGLKPELKKALPIWSREVTGEVEKVWGASHRRFAKVLITGGGAILLKESLTLQFGHRAWLSSDPVRSIARGLWKLSAMKR